MLIGTTLMVITPGFATIGLAAPIIITVARLLQGFSVGGEFGSAVTFLVEHGGERRGYSASWQWATIGMTSIIASLFGLVLTSQLSHQQLVDWGWRVPYVFGLLVGPAGLYIRSRMPETPEFLNAEKPQRMPISELLRRQPVSVLLALGAAVISNSSYYLLLYIPTYGVKTLHLPAYTTFAATLIGGIILAVFSVIAGHYSDRTKPRTQLMLIHGLAVFARRLSVILADGRLSLARHRDIRRRFPQPDQGGLQRRLAVGAVGAVSSRDARRSSVSSHPPPRTLRAPLNRQCPLWVKSRHCRTSGRMSALPPKADMVQHDRDVRFMPFADIGCTMDKPNHENGNPANAGSFCFFDRTEPASAAASMAAARLKAFRHRDCPHCQQWICDKPGWGVYA